MHLLKQVPDQVYKTLILSTMLYSAEHTPDRPKSVPTSNLVVNKMFQIVVLSTKVIE